MTRISSRVSNMRSYFDLFLYSIAILQCFRFYAVNGECCLPATLGICGNPSTFRPNFCADCSAGDPHCGVGECNAEGCDCEGGCRAGMCVPNSVCEPNDCFGSIFKRAKRQSSDTKNGSYKLTDQDAAAVMIQMMDRNEDGKLSPDEIYHNSVIVRKMKLSNDTLNEEFKALDTDHNGFVTDSEIHLPSENTSKPTGKKGTQQRSSGPEIIQKADKNGDGVLNMAEANQYFSEHARVELTKLALEAEIKSLDTNHDGQLSEDELDPENSSII